MDETTCECGEKSVCDCGEQTSCGCGEQTTCGCGEQTSCGCGGYQLDPRAEALMRAVTLAWQRVRDTPIDGEDVCITCSDEGRPGVVIGEHRVRTDAGDEDVDLTLVPGVGPGDRVLVHAGMAIAQLDSASDPEGEAA